MPFDSNTHGAQGGAEPASYPNWLCSPTPRTIEPRPWLLVALLMLWLVPRLAMAGILDTICSDGVYYIHTASALETAGGTHALAPESFNLYQVILMLLHRAGLEWTLAARCWGVLCGSLTVLPLFGWVRRQFDDRVAIIACVLLAIHPKLVEWCPDMVRDPTFLLFFVTTIYLSYRAICESRVSLFCAAGISNALAIHLRFEGWFLLAPIALWAFWRFRDVSLRRPRLAYGTTGFLLAYPAVLVAINLSFADCYSSWVLGSNLNKIADLRNWLARQQATTSPDPAPTIRPSIVATSAPAATPAPAVSPPASADPTSPLAPVEVQAATAAPPQLVLAEHHAKKSIHGSSWLTIRVLQRGFGLVHGLLTLLGLWIWRHVWCRRDNLALACYSLLVVAGIWCILGPASESSSRYALSIVLAAAPFMGLGFLAVADWLQGRFQILRRHLTCLNQPISGATASLLAVIVVVSVIDMSLSRDPTRKGKHALGDWVRKEIGSGRTIVGSPSLSLVGYYAESNFSPSDAHSVKFMVRDVRPDLVVLDRRWLAGDSRTFVVDGAPDLQYEQVDVSRLPLASRKDLAVFARVPVEARAPNSATGTK
jgi:hypothetical protein